MNRRTFMQRCFAGIAGLYVACVPSKAKDLTVADIRKARNLLSANERKILIDKGGEVGEIKNVEPFFKNCKFISTHVCYCHKPGRVMCNYPACSDYNPGNERPYKLKYE